MLETYSTFEESPEWCDLPSSSNLLIEFRTWAQRSPFHPLNLLGPQSRQLLEVELEAKDEGLVCHPDVEFP